MANRIADHPEKSQAGFGLAVMWLLIVAFLVAVLFMFIHPSVTLGLFFAGLVVLGVTTVVSKLHH